LGAVGEIAKVGEMGGIQSKRVCIDGLDIHYLTGGKGEPLIIVHGGSSGASAWVKNLEVLARKYTIYMPDMPGFGSSQTYEGDYSIPKMVEFIDNFAQCLELPNFFLMGHSLGGGISLHYVMKYPEKIRKLVLVSSLCLGKEIAWWVRLSSLTLKWQGFGKAIVSLFNGIKYVARRLGRWEIVAPVSHASVQIGSYISSFTEQTVVLLSQLPSIMVPTLVVWGAKDPVVPSAQAYAAAELIPDCQVKVFANTGHGVFSERINEFSSVLAGFLDQESLSDPGYKIQG
jgi:pimeloyl-ACP methyl ester carboxylesterase